MLTLTIDVLAFFIINVFHEIMPGAKQLLLQGLRPNNNLALERKNDLDIQFRNVLLHILFSNPKQIGNSLTKKNRILYLASNVINTMSFGSPSAS